MSQTITAATYDAAEDIIDQAIAIGANQDDLDCTVIAADLDRARQEAGLQAEAGVRDAAVVLTLDRHEMTTPNGARIGWLLSYAGGQVSWVIYVTTGIYTGNSQTCSAKNRADRDNLFAMLRLAAGA